MATSLEDLPTTKTLMLQFAFFILGEDIFFHLWHRFLHWPVIYPYIHKMHHEHKVTIGLAGEYTHPVQFMGDVAISSLTGSMILGKQVHICTHLLWTVMRICENLDGHCGYEFTWSPYRLLPFSTSAVYHDYHHLHNIGNYSSLLTLWDSVYGTNTAYYRHREKED